MPAVEHVKQTWEEGVDEALMTRKLANVRPQYKLAANHRYAQP
jgi:hypothetical protein